MTIHRRDLAELELPELEAALEDLGVARFHARQLYRWIYRRGTTDLEVMSDLSKPLRAQLAKQFSLNTPRIAADQRSADGTRKLELELTDARRVEAVFIPDTPAMTFCISTQVGCAMGCEFCLTGKMGLVRNLTAGEIAGQVRVLASATGLLDSPFNIVLMGMGEPLHNYDATMKALRILHSAHGLSISPRRITLSTVGIVAGLDKLAREPLMPNLAISLHATTDELRTRSRSPEPEVPARCSARRLPSFSARKAQPYHLRVRPARWRERFGKRCAPASDPPRRNQGQGQFDPAQRSGGNPVRAPLGMNGSTTLRVSSPVATNLYRCARVAGATSAPPAVS